MVGGGGSDHRNSDDRRFTVLLFHKFSERNKCVSLLIDAYIRDSGNSDDFIGLDNHKYHKIPISVLKHAKESMKKDTVISWFPQLL